MVRELVTIGDLASMGPTTRQRLKRASYLRVATMGGIGQTNVNFAPGADSNTAGGALLDAGDALLNYFDLHGVPSEHSSDPNVTAFQTTWNADPANAANNAKLSVDGGYGPNVHDALQALVGAIAPAVNTGGAAPVPSVPGGPTPVTPSPTPTPTAPAKAGMSGATLFLLLAAAAAGGYLLFGRKKRSASVTIHRNPRRGARRRRRML